MKRLLQRCQPLYRQSDFRVLVVLSILLGLAYSFVSPFMSMFGTIEAKMSTVVFGVFMTVTSLSGVALGTILSHYSDTRYSRRKMLLLGSLCGAAGYIGFAFVRDVVPLLLIGSLVLGISTITFSQVFALAREHLALARIPKSETAFYLNAFRMFFALSWTIGPALASWVMVAFSFRGLFLCAALGFLVFALVVWARVPELTAGHARIAPPARSSLVHLLRRPDVLAHFIAFVLVFAAATIGMMNLPLLILTSLGGTQKEVGLAYSIAPLFELPFMLYFGGLATRVDPAKIIRLGIAVAIAYYALLGLVLQAWQVYPIQLLSAAVVAITSGVAITYFQNYLPHHPGSATNLYANAQRIGSTLGYLLFGTLSWRFGYRSVFYFCSALSMIAFALMSVPARRDEPEPRSSSRRPRLPKVALT